MHWVRRAKEKSPKLPTKAMSTIEIIVALLTGSVIVSACVHFSRYLPFEALSLPCVSIYTTLIYFYVIPIATLAGNDEGYLGIILQSTAPTHILCFLYLAGATGAVFLRRAAFSISPFYQTLPVSQFLDSKRLLAVAILCAGGIAYQASTGKLNLAGSDEFVLNREGLATNAFINQALNLLIPISLILLVRARRILSFFATAIIPLMIFMQAGFRFRIVIFATAAVCLLAIRAAKPIRGRFLIPLLVIGVLTMNTFGSLRSYGEGLNLTEASLQTILNGATSFGGEAGISYVTNHVTNTGISETVHIRPWIFALTALIPRAIWPEKPAPDYLDSISVIKATSVQGAEYAGTAAPQQLEILSQFGWAGVPIIAFLYFYIISKLIVSLDRLAPESRLAGLCLVPIFFGYYMQSRGYFFQIIVDGIFIFGPLFFVSRYSRASI